MSNHRDITPVRQDDGSYRIPLTNGYGAAVDEAALSVVAGNHWGIRTTRCGIVYAYGNLGKALRLMHCAIFEALVHPLADGLQVDHIDGDGLNNRVANLRAATNQQNQWNRRKSSKSRSAISSRYKGVDFYKPGGVWRARIRVNGRQLLLGYFRSEESAAEAYDAEARRHFGEFARFNFGERLSR